MCPPLEDLIKLYQQQLETKKFSLSTIRNYINDIHQFINWAQNKSRPVSATGRSAFSGKVDGSK